MTSEELTLENFVYWLIRAEPDDKWQYRREICETVRRFGKNKVLDELERQSQDFKNIGEAVITVQIVKGIRV